LILKIYLVSNLFVKKYLKMLTYKNRLRFFDNFCLGLENDIRFLMEFSLRITSVNFLQIPLSSLPSL